MQSVSVCCRMSAQAAECVWAAHRVRKRAPRRTRMCMQRLCSAHGREPSSTSTPCNAPMHPADHLAQLQDGPKAAADHPVNHSGAASPAAWPWLQLWAWWRPLELCVCVEGGASTWFAGASSICSGNFLFTHSQAQPSTHQESSVKWSAPTAYWQALSSRLRLGSRPGQERSAGRRCATSTQHTGRGTDFFGWGFKFCGWGWPRLRC